MCIQPKYGIITKNNSYSIISNNTSRSKLRFITKQEYYRNKNNNEKMVMIPCKKCRICRLAKANDWATRCEIETKTNQTAIFLTLSYNNENLPKTEEGTRTLKKQDVTNFKKRLREDIYRKTGERKTIKTFECGEYGEKKGRPHYHMIIWGYRPNDLRIVKQNKQGNYLYNSEKLEKIWGKGLIIIGNVSYESASYVARYTNKKIDEKIYKNKEQPYINMSRGKNNGIGLQYWEQRKEKIKSNGGIYVKTNKGVRLKTIPKYFIKKWEEEIKRKQKEILKNITAEKIQKDHEDIKKQQKETLRILKLRKIFDDEYYEEYEEERKEKIKRLGRYYAKKHRKTIELILKYNKIWIKKQENSDLEKYKITKKQQADWNKKLIMSKTSLTEEEYDRQQSKFMLARNKQLKRELQA